jgi:H+/Cl- antiporter ClcA
LHLTADSGLRGPNSDLDIGLDNLQDVKNDIADEFPAVRGKIWWWNCGILIGAIAICLLAMGVYHNFTNSWIPAVSASSKLPSIWLAAFLIPLGAAIGLFVEFVFRVNDDVPYDQLRTINPGRWKPFQRAFNTIIVGYIFAGILGIGAFQVGVASVLLNDFIGDKPILSLVIGFVTGFAFPYVRDLVQQFRPVKRDSPGK